MGHPMVSKRFADFDEIMDENTNNDMPESHNPSDDFEVDDAAAADGVHDAEPVSASVADEPPMSDAPFADADHTQEFPSAQTATPPPPHNAVIEDRLVRDPNATFGGVLSGVANRYGWDVALTRLGFIIIGFMTGGTALAGYLFAWLIIPRAAAWPPVRSTGRFARAGGLSNRDLGFGLLGLAALIAIGIGSGRAAAIIVPLALIAAGVWMLTQSPRPVEAVIPANSDGTAGPVYGAPLGGLGASEPAAPFVAPPVAQQVVEPRSRTRRVAKIGLFGALGLALLALIAVLLIAFAVIFDGEFDFDTTSRRVTPQDEIPAVISQDVGELIVDLREIDFPEDPVTAESLRVSLDAGEITVLLPEDIRVQIEASVDAGDIDVLGQSDDGINAEVLVDESDPHVILEVDLDVGEIEIIRDDEVVRGNGAEIQERS